MNIAVRPPVAQRQYAPIALSPYRSAQGPVLREYLDGRVVIDTGDRKLTGRPLHAAPSAPIWIPIFGSLF